MIQFLRAYIQRTPLLHAQIRIYSFKDMIVVGVATVLPSNHIATSRFEIQEYTQGGGQEPLNPLYTALLPALLDLSIFTPGTTTVLDERDITMDHKTGLSIASRFLIQFKLSGKPLQEAWAEGRKLLNRWTLPVIVGDKEDNAALYFIEDDYQYWITNKRNTESRIGKCDSYADPDDAALAELTRKGIKNYQSTTFGQLIPSPKNYQSTTFGQLIPSPTSNPGKPTESEYSSTNYTDYGDTAQDEYTYVQSHLPMPSPNLRGPKGVEATTDLISPAQPSTSTEKTLGSAKKLSTEVKPLRIIKSKSSKGERMPPPVSTKPQPLVQPPTRKISPEKEKPPKQPKDDRGTLLLQVDFCFFQFKYVYFLNLMLITITI